MSKLKPVQNKQNMVISMDFRKYRMILYISLYFGLVIRHIQSTVDMNEAEIQYLADHLLPEECRILVASAHIKTFEVPNELEKGERKVPDDLTCFELLLHWNSARGEGKGESHTFLEHRLRQMGKMQLADWLGKTVFKELGQDLNETLEEGLKDLANDTVTTEDDRDMPTLVPEVETEDVALWTPLDSICYTVIVGILITFITLIIVACYRKIKVKRREKKYRNYKSTGYKKIGESSGDESENQFDIRNMDAPMY